MKVIHPPMYDEEFVKLKHWLDAEITMNRVLLVIIMGFLIDKWWAWVAVVVYVIFSLIYAGSRLSYVESKHMGYLRIPRR